MIKIAELVADGSIDGSVSLRTEDLKCKRMGGHA